VGIHLYCLTHAVNEPVGGIGDLKMNNEGLAVPATWPDDQAPVAVTAIEIDEVTTSTY
jgi:hypothetical protein